MEIKNKKDYFIIVSLVVSLSLIWGGFYFSYPDFFTLRQKNLAQIKEKEQEQKEQFHNLAFANLGLEAKAFAVYDLNTKELIAGQRENEIFPLASITKIMTVLVASEEVSPDQVFITHQEGDGFTKGEKWSLNSLATITLVSSSNNGALALASPDIESFVKKMNDKAQALGLSDLYFSNPTGLDDQPAPGGQGSALSVAKLLSQAILSQPHLFTQTKELIVQEQTLDGFTHLGINTNQLVNDIPGLLLSKTGYTERAGGNLAIVANIGLQRPIAIVVLGSSEKGRFTDTQKLIQASLNYYSNLIANNQL